MTSDAQIHTRNWFLRNADRRDPNALINTIVSYFADECADAIMNGSLVYIPPHTDGDAYRPDAQVIINGEPATRKGDGSWSTTLAPTTDGKGGGLAASAHTDGEPVSKWRERWYGSEPERGSAIVDDRGNLIAYFGGDEATHAATTKAVAAHNAALAAYTPSHTDTVRGYVAAPDHADIMETIENASDDWQKNGYTSALAEVRDMANVGRSFMEALPEEYSYNDSPAEIVADLQNERDEALSVREQLQAQINIVDSMVSRTIVARNDGANNHERAVYAQKIWNVIHKAIASQTDTVQPSEAGDHVPDAGEMIEAEGTALGEVLCHCSDDDGVPDVGVSVGLGEGSALWIGELLTRDGGDIGIVFHGPNGQRIAAPLWPTCEWQEAADILRHQVGPLLARAALTKEPRDER